MKTGVAAGIVAATPLSLEAQDLISKTPTWDVNPNSLTFYIRYDIWCEHIGHSFRNTSDYVKFINQPGFMIYTHADETVVIIADKYELPTMIYNRFLSKYSDIIVDNENNKVIKNRYENYL